MILQHWTLGYYNSRLSKKLGHLTYLHFFLIVTLFYQIGHDVIMTLT